MSSVRAVKVRDCVIGGPELVVMAGPCAIESREQILQVAEVVASSGARHRNRASEECPYKPLGSMGLLNQRTCIRPISTRAKRL